MIHLQDALDLIATVFGEREGSMTAETQSSSIAGWDSMGTLMLLAELDEKFGIHLEESEIYALKSVGDILRVLEREGVLGVMA